MAEAEVVLPGRACGSCTLCCRMLEIGELAKPAGEWCSHCDIGKGCRIYATRPEPCRGFHCGWLTLPMMDDKWFPAKCRMMAFPSPRGDAIWVHVDPARPNAWREEPFYSDLKNWARAAAGRVNVAVFIRRRAIAILPEEDIDLGVIGPDERILYREELVAGRPVLKALKVKA